MINKFAATIDLITFALHGFLAPASATLTFSALQPLQLFYLGYNASALLVYAPPSTPRDTLFPSFVNNACGRNFRLLNSLSLSLASFSLTPLNLSRGNFLLFN